MFIEEGKLFEGLSPAFRERVARISVSEEHDTGTFLFRQGQLSDHLYIIGGGRLRLELGDQGHIAWVISSPGNAVGVSSVLGRERYTSSAECLVPCTVTKIAREKLMQLFDEDPVSGFQFYKRLARLVGQRLVDTYRLIPAAHGEKYAAPGG